MLRRSELRRVDLILTRVLRRSKRKGGGPVTSGGRGCGDVAESSGHSRGRRSPRSPGPDFEPQTQGNTGGLFKPFECYFGAVGLGRKAVGRGEFGGGQMGRGKMLRARLIRNGK